MVKVAIELNNKIPVIKNNLKTDNLLGKYFINKGKVKFSTVNKHQQK